MAGARGVETLPALWPVATALPAGDAWRLLAGHHLQVLLLALLLALTFLAPNAHQILGRFSPALARAQEAPQAVLRWRPNLAWLAATLLVLFVCLVNLHKETRFLYFQF